MLKELGLVRVWELLQVLLKFVIAPGQVGFWQLLGLNDRLRQGCDLVGLGLNGWHENSVRIVNQVDPSVLRLQNVIVGDESLFGVSLTHDHVSLWFRRFVHIIDCLICLLEE